ncbi:major facilitator superfamily domain-containing protein [Mycena rebaudengoi]|nr:major facilitator superfamily domain-containing protein [Mycena rebaudengoi]
MPPNTSRTCTGSTRISLESIVDPAVAEPPRGRKPRAFWLSFMAIMMATFLSAMDLTAIGIALPTIANALSDTRGDYAWIGSAYALSSTAVIPLSGSLANIFGRKSIMLICIGFFVLGSILAGAAQKMPMMISARGVQGIGGGGIIALSEILVSDLIPLAERGTYKGLIGLAWALACSIGPPLGGALAAKYYIIAVAIHGIASIAVIYYLPVFFLACFGASQLRAAVDILPLALAIAPFAVIGGVTTTISQKYRLVNWIGWAITIVGFGLLSTMKMSTTTGMCVGFQFILSMGLGPLFTVPSFPLLAPLPPDRAAAALALFTFTRTFFQNSLHKNLPADFVSQFPPGFEIAYAAIPHINVLEEPLRADVRSAFATSMAVIWQTMIGVAVLGLLISSIMAEIPMTGVVDENFGLVEEKTNSSLGAEKA